MIFSKCIIFIYIQIGLIIKKCYNVNKLILSENIWDQNPRFIKNQKVCVYRFRKLGLMKKKIKTFNWLSL